MTPQLRNALQTLSRSRVDTSSEDCVHQAIEQLLSQSGIEFDHEVRLNARDRVDFLVGDVAIEVKVGGSTADLERQLTRYAEHEAIRELVVVSSKCRLSALPAEVRGKVVSTFVLWGSKW